ncbi:BTB and MATH domain-containing protein 43-like [Temnothorax curvispinosus]|uniref:BTB and MATH domain-containing protein 43-like n=1 Tax=Temnothorax curvispinosus TaxID=300111 RepID=A0A6J1R7Q9_9HYME|nr:BTB and MATH domain-containing protein 43-like [Temnothorax curvispinosus]
MNLLPWSTELSRNMTYLEDSTSDEFRFKDEESIKFIIGEDQYVISKKSLCAINSSYFKNICLTHKEIGKDMTNELVTNKEIRSFHQILLYIATGSTDFYGDYGMLKDLLTAADKYDVATLKLTCERYLLHYITIDNAVELIQLAFSSNAKFLETHSAAFIKFHIEEIRYTETFQNPQEDLNKIMELIEKSKMLEISTHQFFSLPPTIKETFTLAEIH